MARVPLLLLIVVPLVACSDTPAMVEGGTGDATTAGMAVVCSDYSSTAVAVLDPAAETVSAPLLLHSGSATPSVQIALGGDVDLPTSALGDHTVVLLDRFPAGVLTRVDAVTGDVLDQASTGDGFSSNPHDALQLADGRWLVTRYGWDPASGAGDDVLVLDAAWQTISTVALDDTGAGLARPDRLLAVGDEVWVSLGRVGQTWDTYAEGAVARLDPDGPELLEVVALPDASNCSAMATDGQRVALTCAGDIVELLPDPERSALVLLDPTGAEVGRLRADDPRVGQTFGAGVATLPGGRVAALVYGDLDAGVADRVLTWDPATDSVETAYEASGAFRVFGLATTADGALVVPDADPAAPAVCVVSDGAAPRCLDACAATGLPPRQVRPL